jgi:hypothetical protein
LSRSAQGLKSQHRAESKNMKSFSAALLTVIASQLTGCGAAASLPDACVSGWSRSNPFAKEVVFSRVRAAPTRDEVADVYADFHSSMLEQSAGKASSATRTLSKKYGKESAERQFELGNALYLARSKLKYHDGKTRSVRILCVETKDDCACLADSS